MTISPPDQFSGRQSLMEMMIGRPALILQIIAILSIKLNSALPDFEVFLNFCVLNEEQTVSLELVVVSAELGEGGAVLLQQGDGRPVQPPALQTVLTVCKQFC